jgi:serine/threonine-protein kinase
MIDWESFYNSFRRPDFIPGYEIQNHLGGGAFGEVYKAKKSSIGKAFAIKFLRLDDAAQKDAIEYELEQVRLCASIDHPNLVTIEDMGVVMGVPYLIMGYAGEDTLARRLKRRDLDRASALRYFVQASRGVLALHDRRLAHFDLKPSNVFLNGDVARVGDYGLAKLLIEGRQTLSFGRGTPHYMAPEMLRNRADHRADLYSLGVILFESLCFTLPFASDTQSGILIREDDRPPPFPDDFPGSVRAVVERCLRLDPADRFGSVHELLEALGQTARRGDSVRLPWEGASERPFERERPAAAAPVETPPGTEPPAATRRAGEELRTAAAELARGAALVARGVWDGVVERVSNRPAGANEEPAAAPGAPELGAEVVSVSTLGDERSAAPTQAVVAPAASESPWRAELRRSREERAALAPATEPPAFPVTVPVPPRAAGGFLGSVTQSVIVGTEIMGALVTGPVMLVLRGSAAVFDRIVRGVPAVLGGLIRTVLALLLMAFLGGLVAFVVLAALALNP